MSIIRIENIPHCWNEQDDRFFRIVARLFSDDFTYGAGVLLAENGDVDTPAWSTDCLAAERTARVPAPTAALRTAGPRS